uniref:inorganic diphosphatase n=1 Tax=Guillardia theta TaxID=55529 RepID=A0A7S4U9W6_GUITH
MVKMHRHVITAQKAKVDVSIRRSAHARYSRLKPDKSSIQTAIVPVIIEVPRDQRNKLEYDKDTGTLQLDRVLHSSCHYPGDYGFVPGTLCPDGDPIDVVVLSKFALTPGVVAQCRIVGVMDMEDEKGGDAKLIAVVASEPRTLSIMDIDHVPIHVKSEIQQFFELYKSLEAKPGKPKWVKIRSWGDREQALKELKDSIDLYEKSMDKDSTKDEPLPPVGNVYELTPELCSLREGAPRGVCSAYVEVKKGDANKYEWDKDTGFLTLDRVLHSSIFYPGDYGFIPRTLCGDGDPIDVVILSNFSLTPGVLCDVRVVGALDMADEKGEDQKLLAVVDSDPRWNEIQDLGDVEEHIKREIAQFFETYKELENKPAIVSPLCSPQVRPGEAPLAPPLGSFHPRKKTKFAIIKGWVDKAGALKLLEAAQAAFMSTGTIGCFPKMKRLHIGDSAPTVCHAIVRAPRNTNVKYDVLPKTGLLKADKVLHSAVVYPGDFCSLPQTLAEDGRTVECLCLSIFPLPLGCIVQMRVVALLEIEDQNGPNSKIIGVPDQEPRLSEYIDVDSIPIHVKKEVAEFFNTYKNLEGEEIWTRVTGWKDRQTAHTRIDECRKRWFAIGLRMEDLEEKNEALEGQVAQLQRITHDMELRLNRLEASR